MGLLSKSDILSATDITYDEVTVPQWGGSVRLKLMGGKERGEWDSLIAARSTADDRVPNQREIRATLVALCLVDSEGHRLFASKEDIAALDAKSAEAIDFLYERCRKLNRLGKYATEEAAKNSDATTP